MKDYNAYSSEKHVNVIPEADFKELVAETFTTISEVLRATYGPYGSSIIISENNDTITTKDGYNVFQALGFSHSYKKMVYLAIKKIIERVNKNVGDGTTSCILIADKLFRNIEVKLTSPDRKREALKYLDEIEKELQSAETTTQVTIDSLRDEHFRNIIRLASNYDEELTDVIVNAFDPDFLEDTKGVFSIRNIITETETVDGGNISYKAEPLPGMYRVRVEMDPTYARRLAIPSKVKVVLFDHTFTQNDWSLLTEEHDKETEVIVLATGFSNGFMDNEYLRYLKERALVKQPVKFLIGQIKGVFVQEEIKDLAAVLKQKPWSLNTHANVNYNEIPEYDIQVFTGNCLCFDNVEAPKDYIETLEFDMKRDLSKSLAKKNNYLERIKALSMKAQDTLLTVKAPSSLEAKLIADKIDDCVAIINSAVANGVVPNMFRYAYERLFELKLDTEESFKSDIIDSMMNSVEGLFDDIWRSKHGNEAELTCETLKEDFYSKGWNSFDIVSEEICDAAKFCTSAQYDIEVLVAAISIVKYLITSKALIFDSMLLRQRQELSPMMPTN